MKSKALAAKLPRRMGDYSAQISEHCTVSVGFCLVSLSDSNGSDLPNSEGADRRVLAYHDDRNNLQVVLGAA